MKVNNPFSAYTRIFFRAAAKNNNRVCGDHLVVDRAMDATTIILCDGIGSGIKANLAAVMAANTILEMLRLGFTLHAAAAKMVRSMREARNKDIPFAAFTICKVLSNGQATVISYEMPGVIIMDGFSASVAPMRFIPMGGEVVAEAHFALYDDRAILLCSDGVSQAGMGKSFKMGWTIEGAAEFAAGLLGAGVRIEELPGRIVDQVEVYSGPGWGDDVTAVVVDIKAANVLNILTGPACDKRSDKNLIERFIAMTGDKAVCGSTTAEIAARVLGQKIEAVPIKDGYNQPPQYHITGINLVTEGAVTLNQVYNILGEDPNEFDAESCVSHLARLILDHDAVNFIVGLAANKAHKNIVFRQMGVLPRAVIVEKIAQKLQTMGKLVHVEYA